MKVFDELEIHEATRHAMNGRVALHLHNICFEQSPRCFRDACWKRYECIGHLLDQNKDRLVERAKSLGVNVIFIDKQDTAFQHIDLCGAPLRKLINFHYGRLLFLGKKTGITKLRKILAKFPGCSGWL